MGDVPDTGCFDPSVEGCTGCFDLAAMWIMAVVIAVLSVGLIKSWRRK